MTTHFLAISDLDRDKLQQILTLSKKIDENIKNFQNCLSGKNILFCFEKPSFRTLVGTEVALNQCGASVIHSTPDVFLGKNERESIKDTMRIANHYCDSLFLRVFSHKTLIEVKKHATIPVVNALCDLYHPCQALADIYTIQEHFGECEKLHINFIGDATNVAYSLAEIALIFGHHFTWSGPKAYEFRKEQIKKLNSLTKYYGGKLTLNQDMIEGIEKADIIITDTFVSMGEESKGEKRIKDLKAYQVNKSLWAKTKETCIFLHCLPAHRGQEVTEDVIDGAQSKIIQEAKNRMITARGLFSFLISQS